MLNLTVEKREKTGPKAAELLRSGILPAVVYGAYHESTPIQLTIKDFNKIHGDAGEATIVSLVGLGAPLPTLIHDVALDPITGEPRHVDFYAVTMGEKVQVVIPLEFIGESPAVDSGANLVRVLRELEVEADPMNLPQAINVDLAILKTVGDKIHVSDLVLPEGVEAVANSEEVVALIQEVEEEEKEISAPADLSTIEVEKKGKDDATEESEKTPE